MVYRQNIYNQIQLKQKEENFRVILSLENLTSFQNQKTTSTVLLLFTNSRTKAALVVKNTLMLLLSQHIVNSERFLSHFIVKIVKWLTIFPDLYPSIFLSPVYESKVWIEAYLILSLFVTYGTLAPLSSLCSPVS